MGPTWGWQDPGGSHVGLVNLAIGDVVGYMETWFWLFVPQLNVFSLLCHLDRLRKLEPHQTERWFHWLEGGGERRHCYGLITVEWLYFMGHHRCEKTKLQITLKLKNCQSFIRQQWFHWLLRSGDRRHCYGLITVEWLYFMGHHRFETTNLQITLKLKNCQPFIRQQWFHWLLRSGDRRHCYGLITVEWLYFMGHHRCEKTKLQITLKLKNCQSFIRQQWFHWLLRSGDRRHCYGLITVEWLYFMGHHRFETTNLQITLKLKNCQPFIRQQWFHWLLRSGDRRHCYGLITVEWLYFMGHHRFETTNLQITLKLKNCQPFIRQQWFHWL